MQQRKCPGCGASIDGENNKGNKCRYCGSILIDDDKKEKETLPDQKEPTIIDSSLNKRPKFNIFICFFLIVLCGVPGILYAILVFYLQYEWDRKNKK